MIYDRLKPKQQKQLRTNYYYAMLKRYINSRFTWSNKPDSLTDYMLNDSFLNGTGIIYSVDNIATVNTGLQATRAHGASVIKNDGTYDSYTTSGSDYALTFDSNDNFCILRNGYDCVDDLPLIDRLSCIFTEIDSAQQKILTWSKKSPIFKANSGIKQSQLRQVVTNIIKNDSDINIIDDNSDIINPTATSKNDIMLNISDVNAVDKLHFLSEFYDDMLKRFCTQFGLPFSTTSKSAQNCIDELHDMDLFSRLYNMETIKALKDDCLKINDMFGLKMTVDYSDPFKQQIEEICNRSESNDNSRADTNADSDANR